RRAAEGSPRRNPSASRGRNRSGKPPENPPAAGRGNQGRKRRQKRKPAGDNPLPAARRGGTVETSARSTESLGPFDPCDSIRISATTMPRPLGPIRAGSTGFEGV